MMDKIKDYFKSIRNKDHTDIISAGASEAKALTERPELSKFNLDEVPADLRDREGLLTTTAEGYAVSGRLTSEDVMFGTDSPSALVWYGAAGTAVGALSWFPVCFFAAGKGWLFISFLIAFGVALFAQSKRHMLGMLAYWLVASNIALLPTINFANNFAAPAYHRPAPIVSTLTFLAIMLPVAFAPQFMVLAASWIRRSKLMESTLAGGIMTNVSQVIEQARIKQIERAMTDDSAFIDLGAATGLLRKQGDNYAPDRNMPMGLTLSDLLTHFLILGGTGSGKTSSMFRPLLLKWSTARAGGMLVLDGKGQLAAEMADLPNYELISPETTQLSLVQGLTPEDITEAIVTTQAGDEEKDPTWRQQGEKLLRMAGIMLEGAIERNPVADPDVCWSLYNIERAVNSERYRAKLAGIIAASKAPLTPVLRLAGAYFNGSYADMPMKFKASVVETVNAWIAPITGHRELFHWVEASEGVEIEKALNGRCFGLALPAFRYGSAGVAITALVKLRLYRAAQRRGDNWQGKEGQTSCLLAIDEAQEVLSQQDLDVAPIARSLGIAITIGTQSVEQVYDKFGNENSGNALLAQFRSFVCFDSSAGTLEYVKNRLGDAYLMMPQYQAYTPDYAASLEQFSSSPMFDPHNPQRNYFRAYRSDMVTTIIDKGRETVLGQLGMPT